jgi:hypothetical protein
MAIRPQLQAELWHQRLGHPGMTQLSLQPKQSMGLTQKNGLQSHPMSSCQTCSDAKIFRAPMGPVLPTIKLLPCTQFHLDFGFIRASSDDYGVTSVSRVITLYDNCNSYVLIVHAKTRKLWVFCRPSKAPPVQILRKFPQHYGLKSGPLFLRTEQGGELWNSHDLRGVADDANYVVEPTGSDAASENGKVERPNGTLTAMV